MNGCNDKTTPIVVEEGDYQLVSKYDSIRSYPNGGGIFVLKMIPDENFSGKVDLQLNSDPRLNAIISRSLLEKTDSVFDITINPEQNLVPGVYVIKLITNHAGKQKSKEFKVVVFEWSENSEDANRKFVQFKSWIEHYSSVYKNIFTSYKEIYSTYPQTLIVEHYTFLFSEYEVRLCYHVMIPPYDWSKLCVRNRNKMNPELILVRETDGNIHEIPETDYPSLYGY
jgi:hypothetical protein